MGYSSKILKEAKFEMQNVRQHMAEAWDIILFSLLMFVKVMSLNNNIGLTGQLWSIELGLGCLGSALILVSLTAGFKRRRRIIFLLIIDTAISLIVVTDIVYNRYFSDVTSVALIKQAQLIGEVGDSVKNLIHIRDFIYFIDILAFIPLWPVLKKRGLLRGYRPLLQRFVLCICLLLAGCGAVFASALALNRDQPGILRTMYDKKYVVGKIGDINYHTVDMYRYMKSNILGMEKISDEQKYDIEQWFNEKNTAGNAKYYGALSGRNLIVVQLEAFQSFVLNRSINNQEITPNLNSIAKESLVFDNYYYQTAFGGTSDAEFLSNVSLLPYKEGSVYYQYAGDTYDSMISGFKQKGYYTSVMHANRPGFWNRTQMYKSLGFDNFENEENFLIDDIVGLGLSDESFFKQAVSKLEGYKQPFYTFMISLSSHYPFRDDSGKLDGIIDTGEFNGQLMGDYLNSVKYTDNAIGQLVSMLKKDGLWDNSVVVFYGDHSAIPYENRDQLARLLYGREEMTPLEWFNAQKVVAMIHFPGSTVKKHDTTTACEMDLYPTMANLFGFKAPYALGRDLLNTKEGFMVTRDRGWADNNVAYIQSIDKIVDIKTGKELEPGQYESQSEKAKKYLEVSDATIEHNLIYYFKGDPEGLAAIGDKLKEHD